MNRQLNTEVYNAVIELMKMIEGEVGDSLGAVSLSRDLGPGVQHHPNMVKNHGATIILRPKISVEAH